MKRQNRTNYSLLAKQLKLRKYFSKNRRFNAKKFITKTLPQRFKKISLLQPSLFSQYNISTKSARTAVLNILKHEQERINYKQTFINEKARYKPIPSVRILLKFKNLRNFDKRLNEYYFNSKSTAKALKPLQSQLNGLPVEEQNERIIKYFKKLSELREEYKRLGINRPSDELFILVACELEMEINKNSAIDYNDIFEDDEY